MYWKNHDRPCPEGSSHKEEKRQFSYSLPYQAGANKKQCCKKDLLFTKSRLVNQKAKTEKRRLLIRKITVL